MKYLVFILFVIATFITGCYDRDILDYKEGESINPVTNLTYTVNGSDVVFNWNLPATFPEDIIQPVSVYLTVFKNNVQISTKTIADAPTTYTYTGYNSGSTYRFIFKVKAEINTNDPNRSSLSYSSGAVIEL